ncbi:MAG: BrnA antitoxin family protein [Chloroflexota bacterium]|nr:BrnA antitoxin family protein [Chloroflexota bacterium]
MNAPNIEKRSETGWDRIGALDDSTIDTSDIPPLSTSQVAQMTLRLLPQATSVTVNVDPAVLAWFRSYGDEFEQRINDALRSYLEGHESVGHKPASRL